MNEKLLSKLTGKIGKQNRLLTLDILVTALLDCLLIYILLSSI